MSFVTKLTLRTPDVRDVMSASIASREWAFIPNAAIDPTPPALATATARAGVATEPIGACWIGTEQPTNSVNRVVNTGVLPGGA